MALDKDDDCVICTETLKNARKLSCNHYFHLICLSKWIEKGNKSCPICRKEINLDLNLNSEVGGFWSYGVRLDGRFFSWLPNITFRIVRTENNPAQQDNNDSFHFN